MSLVGAVLGAVASVSAANAAGQPYQSLQPGFSQTLYGVSDARLGGVAFAAEGSPIVSDCGFLGGFLHRFDPHSTVALNGSNLHPETIQASHAGCGLTNHPDGTLYANTTRGIANLDRATGQPLRLLGPAGNTLGIAVDPQTNHLVYAAADCRYTQTCTLLDLDPTNGTSHALVTFTPADAQLIEGLVYDPTGILLLANRAPVPRLTVLDRTGHVVQHVALTVDAIGLAVSTSTPPFVVTVNTDGSLTRLDFPGGDYQQSPAISLFATGGFRGGGAQVGDDGCLYISQDGSRFADNSTSTQNSIVELCGDFARPPGVAAGPTAMFTASKGRNVALSGDGASVVAFSSQFDNTSSAAANVIDDSAFTLWTTAFNQTTNQFVKVQLADGLQVVSQVVLRAFGNNDDPKDFQIRVSTTTADDAAFTTVFTGQYPFGVSAQTFTFPPVTAKYVELFVVDNWGATAFVQMQQFEVWTADRQGGIVSWPYGPTASVVGSSSGSTQQNAIDDDPFSVWFTNQGSTNEFLKVQLGGGELFSINSVRLQSPAGVGPKDFDIRFSTTTPADTAFTTVFSGTTVDDGALQQFSFPTTQARYVELFVKSGFVSGSLQVGSFQVITTDGANAARLGGVGAFVVDSSGTYANSASFVPSNAVDADQTTAWLPPQNHTTNQFLKLLLTEGEPFLIDRFELAGTGSTDGIKDFEVRVSTTTANDASFVTIAAGTLPQDALEHWYSFTPILAKYVELVVVDNYGLADHVRVPDFEVFSPQRGGAAVPFLDLSSSPGAPITTWFWDFGDGTTSPAQHPAHVYAAPGTYVVSLTVTDGAGRSSTTTSTYTVLTPPVPAFTWTPLTPNEGSFATFVDASPGVVTSRNWSAPTTFGPSDTTTSPILLTFPDTGSNAVTLTIVDGDQVSASLTQQVTVLNVPPTVTLTPLQYAIGGQPQAVASGFPVSDPGGSHDVIQCQWDFGDGSVTTFQTSNCSNVSHTYAPPPMGMRSITYVATLTAIDKDGGMATGTTQVIVGQPVNLVNISTAFNEPIGVDYHEPTNKVLLSVNFSAGAPYNFELVAQDGSRTQFSTISGLTDEVYMAAIRTSACQAGFTVGEVFTGTGQPGQIARIAPDGSSAIIPWVTLPGETGLLRGGLCQDQFCAFGGDLIVVTTSGNVWRVTSAGLATKIPVTNTGGFLEGVTTVPNDPTTYGPWAGKILAGNENNSCLYSIDAQGNSQCWLQDLGWSPESPHVIPPNQNFFGVDFGGGRLEGAAASAFTVLVGDVLVPSEIGGDLWDVHWNPVSQMFEPIRVAKVGQWEGSAFAPAGIVEIPPATTNTPTPTVTVTPIAIQTATSIPSATPTSTPTSTITPTASATSTPTGTATSTRSPTNAPTATNTATNSPTVTGTPTVTPTTSPTPTNTSTATLTHSTTPSVTHTPANTATSTASTTATLTATPSSTATATNSATNTPSISPTSTGTPTSAPTVTTTATVTPTITPTNTSTVTRTPTITVTPTQTTTGTSTATSTPAATPTNTMTNTPSGTPTSTLTVTNTPSRTATVTETPTSTRTLAPTNTSTRTPTATHSVTSSPTNTATATPTNAATATVTPSRTRASTPTATTTPSMTNSRTTTRTTTRTAATTRTATPNPSATATVQPVCELYPIALSRQCLAKVSVGTTIDVFNGTQPGNFGWLTWTGDQGSPTLVTSLTPPGNSYTYINPHNPSDHTISAGDWVWGKTGVSNSRGVRNALDTLETIQIVVPVWDTTDRAGNNGSQYRISSFARIQIVGYELPRQNRITATFLGNALCGGPSPPPTMTPTQLPRRGDARDQGSDDIRSTGDSDPTSGSWIARYVGGVLIFARQMIEGWMA